MHSSALKAHISQEYARKLTESSGCCADGCCSGQHMLGSRSVLSAGVVSFGCGSPVALASLRPGETVVDLGSGAGLDCFLASKDVGPGGHVFGVDFTQAMVDKANENTANLGLDNVTFMLADIEGLPQEDASVDVIISNCVINLAPDKDAVFREAYRVLRKGGRLAVSDIVLTRPATTEERSDLSLLTGCISGSLPADEVRGAGFEDVWLDRQAGSGDGVFWFSAAIRAAKR